MLSLLFGDYHPGDGILTALAIFFFFIWVWIVITILGDLFRDHEISGWGKAPRREPAGVPGRAVSSGAGSIPGAPATT